MTFKDAVLDFHPTGSRYICDPPVTNTDNDTVFLVNGFYDWHQLLLEEGWEESVGDLYNIHDMFSSYRKGEKNYIVTEDDAFFLEFVYATEAAKALNLRDKAQRVALFDSVRNASRNRFTGISYDIIRREGFGDPKKRYLRLPQPHVHDDF